MKCPICNKVELTGKQTYCSAKCRKQASRDKDVTVGSVTEQSDVTVVPTKLEAPRAPEAPPDEHGHWIGKPPHRGMWTDCLRENCAQADRQTPPDWEVTCTKLCCAR